MNRGRLAAHMIVALLPPTWKPSLYRRCFGFSIHPSARIGITVLAADRCEIGPDVSIGHLNAVLRVEHLVIGDHVRVGFLNLFRGGRVIDIGRYAEIIRRNELNSIPDADAVDDADPTLVIGPGAVITDGHRLDFTDRITIGRRAIIGGRNSSLWTHNRQRTAPVTVGDLAYVGSEIRMAPGSSIPARSIVGIGSVVVDDLQEESSLIAGVPARALKALADEDLFLVERKTRTDLPDDL